MNGDPRGAIAFAEKLIELLDEGRFTATYKYALLLALMDVCLERTLASGAPPDTITTRQLAEKIVELYWPHTIPFSGLAPMSVLRQNHGGQAEIVSAIARFRAQHAADPTLPRWEARINAPAAYERLIRTVEWKLIEMPLPRLQMIGRSLRTFIYEIYWDERVTQGEVTAYQNGESSDFDNRVMLKPGVGEYFLQLNGLLRPLIQRHWAVWIAQHNRLDESQLEMFLFGADRTRTARIRAGLWEIQDRRCFYCDSRIRDPVTGEVDHFVPWSRYPDDTLDNFVVSDKRCNGLKSSSLAAANHLAQWTRRFAPDTAEYAQLAELAGRTRWDRRPDRSLSVARAIYLRLPGDARLWLRGREFVEPDPVTIGRALNSPER